MNTRKSGPRQFDPMDLLSPQNINSTTTTTANNNNNITPKYPYYSSPNSTSLDEGLLANGLKDIDVSGNCITRIVQSNSSKLQAPLIQSTNNDVISSQVIKKVITHQNIQREEELRVKENYLQQLKSIDISKFSYPNENKPATDYTYAKTSSYLSGCNQNDDTLEMPNLRRRSRISPTNNNANSSKLSFCQQTSFSQKLNSSIVDSKKRLGFFERIKSTLFTQKQVTVQTTTTITSRQQQQQDDFVFKKPAVPLTQLTFRLNRNIGLEHEFEEHNENNTNQAPIMNQTPQEANKKTSKMKFIFYIILAIVVGSMLLFVYDRYEKNKNFTLETQLAHDFYSFAQNDIYATFMDVSDKALAKSNDLYQEYYPQIVRMYEILTEKLLSTKEIIYKHVVHLYELANETIVSFDLNEIKLKLFQNKANNQMENSIDYKLSSNNQVNIEQSKQIVNDINLLKEKIFNEAVENLNDYKNNQKLVDIDLMRKELDQKFNYTLNLMSNKLVDQAMQIESSKSAHEKEIKQMKSVLDELESRYTYTFNNLQEQLHKQKQVLEQQQQSMQLQNEITQSSVQNSFRNSLENEQISFKKIEEYINKTFYIYNADKTGMTDFASESIGGSILFTRCTETYQDNSRWFTVFDVPISRVSVSPRVVIQGSIQPGNCWSFKGSKGNLFIKLAARITPKSFSLEHIPKELSITGRIDSAPQNFTVYVS